MRHARAPVKSAVSRCVNVTSLSHTLHARECSANTHTTAHHRRIAMASRRRSRTAASKSPQKKDTSGSDSDSGPDEATTPSPGGVSSLEARRLANIQRNRAVRPLLPLVCRATGADFHVFVVGVSSCSLMCLGVAWCTDAGCFAAPWVDAGPAGFKPCCATHQAKSRSTSRSKGKENP